MQHVIAGQSEIVRSENNRLLHFNDVCTTLLVAEDADDVAECGCTTLLLAENAYDDCMSAGTTRALLIDRQAHTRFA